MSDRIPEIIFAVLLLCAMFGGFYLLLSAIAGAIVIV